MPLLCVRLQARSGVRLILRVCLTLGPVLCCGDLTQSVLIEAEAFADLGGWVVDQQFMDQVGSPFVLAHGLGTPVQDAVTEAVLPGVGVYRVFVRTRDWVAPWQAAGAPGRFQVRIDGQPLPVTFGTEGADWHWQDGGPVRCARRRLSVALHDLTGFEGRCDAVLLSSVMDWTPPDTGEALGAFRRQTLGLPEKPSAAGEFDLVVTGGGIAGMAAALSAARLGLTVALVQDRPVLGGNNSSEVRVWLGGTTNHAPYPRIGDVVRELNQAQRGHPGTAEMYEDDRKRGVLEAEERISVFLGWRVNGVEKDGTRIRAVVAQNIRTAARVRVAGRWFADCTGDGCIGFLAGADFDMTAKGHMGRSNLWHVVDTGAPSPFPRCPWAADFSGKSVPEQLERLGKWFWEAGFDHDPIEQGEYIRDTNFRAMYGAWDCLKNVRRKYPHHRLEWAAYISGKRESRRLLGDIILTRQDLLESREYPDGCVPTSWSIDLHLPDSRYEKGFEGRAFLSKASFTQYKRPYWVPYRCLYSRNVPNLFMAGRNISVTHGALGTVRVMRTTGMMGEIVGMAAAICRRHGVEPRGVYERHWGELQALMREGVGKLAPDDGLSPPEWLSKAGENLARSAAVRVSSCLDAVRYPPAHINDGKLHTWDNGLRWVSQRTMPQQVELSWDVRKGVSAARIVSGYREGGGRLSAPIGGFVLEFWDGQAWQGIPGTTVTGNTHFDWHATFGRITAQRVRLVVSASHVDAARVWEIELYDLPAGG